MSVDAWVLFLIKRFYLFATIWIQCLLCFEIVIEDRGVLFISVSEESKRIRTLRWVSVNVSKSCFCCNFSLWFCLLENLFVARLSFHLFYNHKQFCSRFVAFVELVPGLKQLLNDVF